MKFCELRYAVVGPWHNLALLPLKPLIGGPADFVQDVRAHVSLLDFELPGDALLHLFLLVIGLLAEVAPVVLIPRLFFQNLRVSS